MCVPLRNLYNSIPAPFHPHIHNEPQILHLTSTYIFFLYNFSGVVLHVFLTSFYGGYLALLCMKVYWTYMLLYFLSLEYELSSYFAKRLTAWSSSIWEVKRFLLKLDDLFLFKERMNMLMQHGVIIYKKYTCIKFYTRKNKGLWKVIDICVKLFHFVSLV